MLLSVSSGTRLAITEATPPFHRRLRARCGLAPDGRAGAPSGLAYCGQEFRVYSFMRIGDAVRLFAAINERWDVERLRGDFEIANLDAAYEVRRMKRAYQRALVLALATAAQPSLLVVENAEEFDEAPTSALLERAVRRAPSALVTFGAGAGISGAESPNGGPCGCDRTLAADDFEAANLA